MKSRNKCHLDPGAGSIAPDPGFVQHLKKIVCVVIRYSKFITGVIFEEAFNAGKFSGCKPSHFVFSEVGIAIVASVIHDFYPFETSHIIKFGACQWTQ